MVTAQAVIHGDRERLLEFDASEHPVALQLGGSEPVELARAARIGVEFGYDEINLNVGCPSDRVQSGRFGACLMREPALVCDCVAAMRGAVADRVVTVKCRIGVDEQDEDAALSDFVGEVHASGCDTFIVHARKAWLQGLSPKENREIPPLNYARVYRLKQTHPQLTIVINGGISTVDEVREHLRHVDGVMLGRTAYHEPYRLAELEAELFAVPLPDRDEVLARLRPYVEAHLARGDRLQHITRHILGLYQGLPGARAFRRVLSEQAHRADAGWDVVERAMAVRRSRES
jgi:tRNA-dihydrouridine synthase A